MQGAIDSQDETQRQWACATKLGAHRCGVGEAWDEMSSTWRYVMCWLDIVVA